jgi:hypothetical protein
MWNLESKCIWKVLLYGENLKKYENELHSFVCIVTIVARFSFTYGTAVFKVNKEYPSQNARSYVHAELRQSCTTYCLLPNNLFYYVLTTSTPLAHTHTHKHTHTHTHTHTHVLSLALSRAAPCFYCNTTKKICIVPQNVPYDSYCFYNTTVFLNSINWLFFVMSTNCVLCKVRTAIFI